MLLVVGIFIHVFETCVTNNVILFVLDSRNTILESLLDLVF